MCDNVKIYLPNTREVFVSKKKYIEFNKKYPGHWYATIKEYNECEKYIITTVLIENSVEKISFYVTSYFTIDDYKIKEIKEYWGNNGEPPVWRVNEKLSERY